jgi:thiamine-monophosphate kinase
MDISDGLLADCGHIAKASAVRLLIEREKLPLSEALLAFVGEDDARVAALSGGDDYVLVLPCRLSIGTLAGAAGRSM